MNPVKKILAYAESLRFPVLVLFTAILFVADLMIPDVIPFVDELLLGLLMLGLGRIRKPKLKSQSSLKGNDENSNQKGSSPD